MNNEHGTMNNDQSAWHNEHGTMNNEHGYGTVATASG